MYIIAAFIPTILFLSILTYHYRKFKNEQAK